jgi:guanylate kinase
MIMTPLLLPRQEGLCFIVSAPAGTGKTTLVQLLTAEFPSVIASISYTTRPPRMGEISGRDYHFVNEAEFKAKIDAHDFLEYVTLYGYYYGTSLAWIRDQQQQGRHVVLVIDTQGAAQLREKLEATFIFISPPSLEVLKNRLANRQTESIEVREKRLAWAEKEMQAISNYDYHIVNDDLMTAYQVLRGIVIAESHRIEKNKRS